MRGCLSGIVAGLALGSIVCMSALSLLTPRYGWPIYLELFAHFQLQYLLICLVLTGVLVFLGRRRTVWVALFCCALVSAQIVPWYWPPGFLGRAADKANLRVLVANLNTQNTDYEKILAIARAEQPDLAVFMEVDQPWVDQLNTLSDILPYSSGQASPYHVGIMLYSRQPLVNPEINFFGTEINAAVVSQVNFNNQPLSVVAAHPPPPIKSPLFHTRNRQLDQIGQYLQTVESPTLLLGDLNLTMWSPYYQRLERQAGLRNARKGFGIIPSWPTRGTYHQLPDWASLLFAMPIDHCLLSPSIHVTDVRTGAETGSDHLPLIVDLRV
ncbi:MAG: endonuclease/exonuclease/phosphatase family protein [Cyanobacteria bacterium P01_A01_bin.114]